MALTTAQQVRLKIQDQSVLQQVIGTGDGAASAVEHGLINLSSGTAFVYDSNGQWSATGATLASGWATFSGPITAFTGWMVRGVNSTFSDDEIGQFTADGGSINGAAVQAIEALMFDSLKRAKWAAPDGTNYDDTMAMKQLNDMWDRLRDDLAQQQISEGGFNSWAEGQNTNW